LDKVALYLIIILGGTLVGGLIFGMAAGLFNLLWTASRFPRARRNIFGVTPHQTGMISLPADPDAVYQRAPELLQSVKMAVESQSPETRSLKARIPPSMASLGGEVIEVSVEPAGAGQTRLTVSSRPALRTVLLDFGKNAQNVETVIAVFQEYFRTGQ